MKKFKFEIGLIAVLFISVVILLWNSLTGVQQYLPIGLLAVGVIVLLGSFFIRKEVDTREVYAPKYHGQALLSCIIGILVIICAVVLLHRDRFSKTFDVTKNKVNSLSQETLKILQSLDQEVQVFCIPSQNPSENYCSESRDLVGLYAKNSKNFQDAGAVNFSDQELLARIQPAGYARLVLISPTNRNELLGEITESKLTNAILNLVRFKKVVYFLTGHGEPTLEYASNGRSYQDVAEMLKAKSYESQEWDYTKGDVPQDGQVVIVGSNTIPYGPAEKQMLTRLLARGTRLIVTINPYKESGLDDFLSHIGLKLNPDLLILNRESPVGKQLQQQNISNPPVLVTNFSFRSPITNLIAQSFQKNAVMTISGARTISAAPIAKDAAYSVQSLDLMEAVLAISIPMTVQDRNRLDRSRPVPYSTVKNVDMDKTYPVAFDVEIANAQNLIHGKEQGSKQTSEVIVFGFDIADEYNKSGTINSVLIPLSVAHLYRDQELVSIPHSENVQKHFNLSRNPGAYLPFFAAFLPLITAIAGIFVWFRRRSA